MYKNILNLQWNEYNGLIKRANKNFPSYSKEKKSNLALAAMMKHRMPDDSEFAEIDAPRFTENVKLFQYRAELLCLNADLQGRITRYYIKDNELLQWLKDTEVKEKEVKSLLDELNEMSKDGGTAGFWGVLGQKESFCIHYMWKDAETHIISVLTDEMNYTFIVEQLNREKTPYLGVFNLAMNFLLYIEAFPECLIDGVPPSVKKNSNAKVVNVSNKIISETTDERGFVKPHFRSGYFRHFRSDYFVNCKGSVKFIASTMVKGRAKTVLTAQEVKE